jgi:hypothetical protein
MQGAITEHRITLCEKGFSPIPLFGKEPPAYGKNNQRKGLSNWQTLDGATREQIEMWGRTWPDALNTGVLTKHVPVLDVDILDEEAARAVEDLAREFHEEHGNVLVRIGQPPKRAIPFRTDEPFEKIVVNIVAPNGGVEKLEFLGDGQQIACFGIHPGTHAPYRWHGGEPGQIAREELPYIRGVDAQKLIDDAVELLIRDFGYSRAPKRPKEQKGNGGAAADWQWLIENIREGRELHDSLRNLAAKLTTAGMSEGAAVNHLYALMDGSTAPHDERWKERRDDIPRLVDSAGEMRERADAEPQHPRRTLDEVHAVFRKWLGNEYDIDTIDATLAAAASERLTGDPLWLLIVAGPGGAKTETVQSLAGAGAHVTSTITSEGALLSATPRRDKHKKATGGLLRKIGDRGVLVIKDVTSILSADSNTRASVLAALREVHDGRWERNVGTDGGQTLTWTGRIIIVGAVTTAWDSAHVVVATMGDRFVLLRPETEAGRKPAGKGAIRNTGGEAAMRAELAAVVGGIIGHMNMEPHKLSGDEEDRILNAADIVTMARSAVERDYRGEIVFAHDPEMPTRFAKQLVQMLRGAVAVGMSSEEGMRLALRCARDSIPPLRRHILLDLARNPRSRVTEVRKRISKPRNTVRRELECLHMLGVLTCDEEEKVGDDGKKHTTWHYQLAGDYDVKTLLAMAGREGK